MEECPGQRDGSTIYYFDGHMYRKNRSTESSSYYRCATRGCGGRVIQKHQLGTIVAVSPHNHEAEPNKYNLRRFLAAMQRRVNLERTPILDIYQQEASRFPGIEQVMPYHSLQLQMEKRRRLNMLNDLTQNKEMKQLHFLNLCDIQDMTKNIRVRESQDPLGFNSSGENMVMMESHVERFLEQRLEHLSDHVLDSHFDQNSDLNNSHPRCEVTMNNQGGDKLHFNGYSYSKKAISANAIRWTCATPTRSDTRCKGAITTDRERPYHNPRSLVEHNHPPEDSEASIMRDIARAKRRFWRKTFPHPLHQIYPWMLPLQQMQEQSGSRDDASSLEASFGMGGAAGMMENAEAGPSGYIDDDDVRVKMEPEWVDAGALEPNCELEGQFDDNQDFNATYSEDPIASQNYQMYNNQQQSQQLPLVQDSQDPVKLHVPGKPNLTITVAPTRQGSSQSSASMSTPPPLHLLNPLLNRKRGRPRGSAYGSYSESDDRVTTILTDSIIASQKLEKMGVTAASAYRQTAVNTATVPTSLAKPRSRDPEALRAAEIVNGAQNRSGPRVNEELEKVHLKLRQEVLALEVQNLKAEREKLKAYRRNVSIRREIMELHLQLGKGFPSECASSGRGFDPAETFGHFLDTECDNDFSLPTKQTVSVTKKLPNVSITRQQPGQSPKITIRKSLQTASRSPNASPLSTSSGTKGGTPPPAPSTKQASDSKDQSGISQSDSKNSRGSDPRQASAGRRGGGGNKSPTNSVEEPDGSRNLVANRKSSVKPSGNNENNQELESKGSGESFSQTLDAIKDELVPLDSVSSDLSIEMLSEPGSSQWTTQSSAPMTEHEGFDDIQFEGDDSYDNTGSIGEFSGEAVTKEPPDNQFSTFEEDTSPQKRRRVENMWEPDEPL